MNVLTLDDVDVAGKRVLVREDLNVPVSNGRVSSDARIRAALPTLQRLLDAGAAVLVCSHLGRPQAGVPISEQPEASLAPVANHLAELLGRPVQLEGSYLDGVDVAPGEIRLLENVRCNAGETEDDEDLSRRMAALCDVFVMDAFGTAHRAQVSTHGVARFAPVACAGPLLQAELQALGKALDKPARPLVAVVGGSKVSSKLEVLERLAEIADQVIVGGGIANNFIAAAGHNVGKSLFEPDLVETAARFAAAGDFPIPVDVMGATALDASAPAILHLVDELPDDEMILDVGPETARRIADVIAAAGTVIWNGPLGVFEIDQFGEGTRMLALAIAESDAFSIAGGGDTLAAIDKYEVADKVSYISTGGGAFLEFVEGKQLPAVVALEAARAAFEARG